MQQISKINVVVIANGSSSKIISDIVDLFGIRTIKVKITAPKENGRANIALIKLLAEYLAVKNYQIKIINGKFLPKKIIEIIRII